jgi:hypothetical protein
MLRTRDEELYQIFKAKSVVQRRVVNDVVQDRRLLGRCGGGLNDVQVCRQCCVSDEELRHDLGSADNPCIRIGLVSGTVFTWHEG